MPSVERLKLAAAPRFTAIDQQYSDIRDRQRADPHINEERSEKVAEFNALCLSAIDRLTSKHDVYSEQALREMERHPMPSIELAVSLYGLTQSLRRDVYHGWLITFDEQAHAHVLGTFLDLASRLLRQALVEPAAVVLAGVVETRLHQLASKFEIPITARLANKVELRPLQQLNDDLAQVAYHQDDHHAVERWLVLHQRALLRDPGRYDRVQLTEMAQHVRDFVTKYPA